MFVRISLMTLGGLMATILAGCGPRAERDAGREYDIRGKVTQVAADGKEVTIDHEPIPGLMKAMEMPFPVADANVLKDIKTGDTVKGRLRVLDGAYTILRLEKTEATAKGAKSAEADEIREALAKLSDTDRPLAEAQMLCPISGKPLGSMDVPTKVTLEGQPVFLCCDGCDNRALKDPAKTLAKLKTIREKNKGGEK
jgi:Cu/Ag efflux protein CusF